MKFSCTTLFDITETGVTGHFKSARVPFQDRSGQIIADNHSWNRSRNQQRNWEAVSQIISMRTQVFDVTVPECCDHKWSFEFATETAGVYGTDADPVQVLCQDATGVPMLLNLNNVHGLQPITIVNGPLQNIWFDAVTLNT